MIAVNRIETLIPQRAPFIMIDKLLSFNEKITCTALTIRPDNIFVKLGEFKEPGLVENIAQTAAARAGYIAKTENKLPLVGYIGSVNHLEIFSLPKTGDELITEVTFENQIFDVSLISGKITCDKRLIAQCNMKIFINQPKIS